MKYPLRIAALLFLTLAAPIAAGSVAVAQERPTQERIVRDIETRGFTNVAGLRRRGVNYVFQAQDLFGNKVRVVMNAETGEIVGLSRVMPDKK